MHSPTRWTVFKHLDTQISKYCNCFSFVGCGECPTSRVKFGIYSKAKQRAFTWVYSGITGWGHLAYCLRVQRVLGHTEPGWVTKLPLKKSNQWHTAEGTHFPLSVSGFPFSLQSLSVSNSIFLGASSAFPSSGIQQFTTLQLLQEFPPPAPKNKGLWLWLKPTQ